MMKQKLFRAVIVLSITAAALAAAFLLWHRGALLQVFSPWSVWTDEKTVEQDSGERTFRISLKNKRVSVFSGYGQQGFAETWQSPGHLKIQDFLFCDIDSDNIPELMLLCWYIGTPSLWDSGQPVIGNRQWTQHIYIYKPVDDGSMHEHWLASRIMQNIACWEFDEALRLFFTDQNGEVTRWDWFGWGLKYFADGYPEIKCLVSGDCLIHQRILEEGRSQGNFDFLFEHISPELKAADLAVLGQESLFVPPQTGYSGFPLFRTPILAGEAAVKAGFTAAACATNHAMDAGAEGINTTAAFYEEKRIPCLGILPNWKTASDEPPYHLFVKNGIRIALFNYTYGTNVGNPDDLWPGAVHLLTDEETVRKEIAAGKEEGGADVSVVIVHWGTEYASEPDETQRRWARVFLECGVDAVIGSHPHVLQPLEILTDEYGREMPVFWSLGNLVSRQDQPEQVLGGLAEFTVRKTPDDCSIVDCQLIPVITHQTEENTTVYLLSEYTEELAGSHRLDVQKIISGVH